MNLDSGILSMDDPRFSLIRGHLISLNELAGLTGVNRDLIHHLVKLGILSPVAEISDTEMLFRYNAILLLKKIIRLKTQLGLNYNGVGLAMELLDRINRLETELKQLRSLFDLI